MKWDVSLTKILIETLLLNWLKVSQFKNVLKKLRKRVLNMQVSKVEKSAMQVILMVSMVKQEQRIVE